MKIRKGFVSNSSSSSFIIDAENTTDALEKILNGLQRYYENNSFYKNREEPIKNYIKYHTNKNNSICIPWVVNYPTIIHKLNDDRIRIDTCNNIYWEEYLDIENYEDDDENRLREEDVEINFDNYEMIKINFNKGPRKVKILKDL